MNTVGLYEDDDLADHGGQSTAAKRPQAACEREEKGSADESGKYEEPQAKVSRRSSAGDCGLGDRDVGSGGPATVPVQVPMMATTRVLSASSEDKGRRHEFEDVAVQIDDARGDKSSPLRVSPGVSHGFVTPPAPPLRLIRRTGGGWESTSAPRAYLTSQVEFYAVMDGHAGPHAAEYAGECLHRNTMAASLVPGKLARGEAEINLKEVKQVLRPLDASCFRL
jgi:hypothetical protein